MYKIVRYSLLIVVLLISTCTQQESRKMWQPSHSYIGVEPNDDAPVKAGAEALKNYSQDNSISRGPAQN